MNIFIKKYQGNVLDLNILFISKMSQIYLKKTIVLDDRRRRMNDCNKDAIAEAVARREGRLWWSVLHEAHGRRGW